MKNLFDRIMGLFNMIESKEETRIISGGSVTRVISSDTDNSNNEIESTCHKFFLVDEIKNLTSKELVIILETIANELQSRIKRNVMLAGTTPDNKIRILKDFERLLLSVSDNCRKYEE
jgi:hypothetical protein